MQLVLIIIAAITACFIGWQARETRRAADAAQRSTAALINSERAWVVPELIPHSYQGKDGRWYRQDHVPLTTEEVLVGSHLLYSLKLTNMGRTPAQILGFEMRYTCLPEGVRDLPTDPSGEAVEYHEFHHLLRGEGNAIEVGLPVVDAGLHMRDSWDAIRKLEKTAVFHGSVKYRHMFSTTEDSHADFCYVYSVQLNRLSSVGRHTRQR